MENTKIRFYGGTDGLMAVTTVVHVFAGGPENYTPLRASGMDPVPLATMSVAWHMVTLQLIVTTVALAYLVRHTNPVVWGGVFVMSLGSATLFIGYGLSDFGDILTLPQWIAFAGTTALLLATRR